MHKTKTINTWKPFLFPVLMTPTGAACTLFLIEPTIQICLILSFFGLLFGVVIGFSSWIVKLFEQRDGR